MKCPHCGAMNDADSKFCMTCGKQIPLCPTCGRVLTSRDPFCMYDGTPLPAQLLALVSEEIEILYSQAPQAPADTASVVSYCMNCGTPVYNGEDYCDACKAAAVVTNVDYVKPAKAKKKGGLVVVLVLLLILLLGCVFGYLAIRNEWIDAPEFLEFLVEEDSGNGNKSKDEDEEEEEQTDDNDGETDPDSDSDEPIGDTTAPTAEPTEEPTEEETEEPTEEATEQEDDPLLYFVENCDRMYFTEEDIEGFDADMCRIARNACYAKSGRIFTSTDLQEYFSQFDWYEGTVQPGDFHSGLLNHYQSSNIALIMEYEEERGYN